MLCLVQKLDLFVQYFRKQAISKTQIRRMRTPIRRIRGTWRTRWIQRTQRFWQIRRTRRIRRIQRTRRIRQIRRIQRIWRIRILIHI